MPFYKSIFCVFNLIFLSQQTIRFTNLKCTEYDRPFATIPICKLIMIQRGVAAFDLHVQLHRVPVNNVSINFQLLKKTNSYRPFFYNISANFCQVMKNAKMFPIFNVLVQTLARVSNINHTCPYDHDIIVKHLIIKDEVFKIIPFPQGDYLFKFLVGAYNDWKALIQVYFYANDK